MLNPMMLIDVALAIIAVYAAQTIFLTHGIISFQIQTFARGRYQKHSRLAPRQNQLKRGPRTDRTRRLAHQRTASRARK